MKVLFTLVVLFSFHLSPVARAEGEPEAPAPDQESQSIGDKIMNSGIGSNTGSYDGDRFRCEDQCENAYFHRHCMTKCLGEVGREYHGQ